MIFREFLDENSTTYNHGEGRGRDTNISSGVKYSQPQVRDFLLLLRYCLNQIAPKSR